jgi:peptidoglycan/xylan/chitin deacetylase (PgdA/CDA1 family)
LAKGFVLAFHSHNISGNGYETNDHVALDESLGLLAGLGVPVLRLASVVDALRAGSFAQLPERFACLTFDDGSDYDWLRLDHPLHGWQEPMAAIVARRRCVATSFVIASPAARDEIAGPQKAYRLSDDWWADAQACGYFDIGSHGWNHVHPAVSEMQASPALVENFGNVRTPDEAELQIGTAARYIQAKAGARSARLFAYPYGQVSDYLADEWLPAQDEILAAFSTEDRPLEEGADIWRLPRFVCGWHWKSNAGLEDILAR